MKKNPAYWEDPRMFGENKREAHNLALPYDNGEDALAGADCPYKQTLNGTWSFIGSRERRRVALTFCARMCMTRVERHRGPFRVATQGLR
jgi:hypothetical protein